MIVVINQIVLILERKRPWRQKYRTYQSSPCDTLSPLADIWEGDNTRKAAGCSR